MNTNPDEAALALWLDDELAGGDLAAVETWASGRPAQLAAREEVRRWRAMMAAIPAAEEPPYPDFFNSRVLQSIREQASKLEPVPKKSFFRQSWLMPLAACAGMALAFWVGTKTHATADFDVAGAPRAIPVEPVVYTPETGVKAECFASTQASAMVVVLNGVAAIPDATDFSETVEVPRLREIDSTADNAVKPLMEEGP
jgi:anti-sigma factor RsiW